MEYLGSYQMTSNVGQSVSGPSTRSLPSNDVGGASHYDKRFVHFQEFLVDWKKSQPDNCCICLDNTPGVDNDLLFCASPNCDVCVHQECYGVRTTPVPEEAWYCDRCRSPDSHVAVCKLCPIKRGALKKLKDGSAWVHVVCALWWPQVQIEDTNGLEIVSIKDIPADNFHKHCILCENTQDSQVGACVGCDFSGCSQKFHITCAQEWDLLEESTDVSKLNPGQEPYYVYCKQHGRNPQAQMNPWALWSRKKDIYYDSLCKTNLELVQSVQERETPIGVGRERRRSIQYNGFALPPIESFKSLNALIESPKTKNSTLEENGFIQKFERIYSAYEKERADFLKLTDQLQTRQVTILDNLTQKAFLSAQRASRLQKEQQTLEQENRTLQLEVSELKYGLLNLCSLRGLRMIQKVMGRPKDGLEFYPHQDMILDYFLEVSHHIVHSQTDSQLQKQKQTQTQTQSQTLPPRSCLCSTCGRIVDFSITTIACSLCGSWSHLMCLPSHNRPVDCTKTWMCSNCLTIDSSHNHPHPHPHYGLDPPVARGHSEQSIVHPLLRVRASSLGPREQESNLNSNATSPYNENTQLVKRPRHEHEHGYEHGLDHSHLLNRNVHVGSSMNPSPGSPSNGLCKQEIKSESKSDIKSEDPPPPYQQNPRFPGDEYTPRWVRGVGKAKEGLCPHCSDRQVWLKIKISAYWYHLNYQHGISSITGKQFRAPLEYRVNPETDLKEALCHKCRNWINSESPRNKPVNVEEIYWWKHAQKCHQ